jgi:hypothetical protein
MAWTKPLFTRGVVNEAGDALAHYTDNTSELDLSVINNWRAAHSYPLQVLKMALLTRAKRIDPRALVAQRLKRLSSIALNSDGIPACSSPECTTSVGVVGSSERQEIWIGLSLCTK